MDTQSRKQKFPPLIAREKAHSLERFCRLVRHAPASKVWRSWGDVAGYSAKRLALLSGRADRPVEKAEHRPLWFGAVRTNVARIGRDACRNPWKHSIDISIRRFREWWEAPYENHLWMAVALIETARLAKRTGRQKAILCGWNACFTRNRSRINRGNLQERFTADLWRLCATRNAILRFSLCGH